MTSIGPPNVEGYKGEGRVCYADYHAQPSTQAAKQAVTDSQAASAKAKEQPGDKDAIEAAAQAKQRATTAFQAHQPARAKLLDCLQRAAGRNGITWRPGTPY